MNDLAEKALQGLDAARRQVVSHPASSLAVAGFLVSGFVVVAGGVAADARPTRTLTSWLGLQEDHGWRYPLPGALLLSGVALLVLLWLLTLEVVRRTAMPEPRVWRLVTLYAAPFVLGPPLMDTAAYGYTAFGLIQRAGRNPYTDAPSSLGGNDVVDFIDPAVRGVPSAAGPLGSVLQHLAVSVGSATPLGTLLVLRAVGLIAAVAITRSVADLAGGPTSDDGGNTRAVVIALCALNPLVLLYVVASPHLDGPMMAFALAALVAVRRRRWLPAVVLAGIAGSIGPPALVMVPVVIVAHVLGRRRTALWRVLLRDGIAAVLVIVGAGVVQPGGFGWVDAVSDQFSSHTPYAVSYAVGRVLAPIVRGASFDDLAAAGRITCATAATCLVVYLLLSARHRSVERTAGFALLAMALLAPNLYPWYLLWGLLCLAPTAVGDRRTALLALTAAGCVLVPPGFGDTAATVITAVGLAVVAAPLAVLVWRRRRATLAASAADGQRPPETSRTAGRTSAR